MEISDWDGIPSMEFDKVSSDHLKKKATNERVLREKHYANLSSLDWPHEYARAQAEKHYIEEKSKWFNYIRQSSRWLILLGTGVLIGGFTSSLDYLYKWLSDLKGGVCSNGVYMTYSSCCKGIEEGDACPNWKQWDEIIHIDSNTAGSFIYKYFLYIITSLILATASAILVKDTKFAKNSGIAEVKTIISGVVLDEFLDFKTLLIKAVGLTLIVSSGVWAGKEGPLVHISCCCATLLMKYIPVWIQNEAKEREILVAASAAGISVAFNAPISGVLFTLEQLTSYFNPSDKMWTSFFCAMTGVVVLNSFKEGIDVYVTMDNQWLSVELFGFLLLGVLGGVFGPLFNNLNIKFAQLRSKYISSKGVKYEILEILVLSIFTSVVSYPLVFPRLPLTTLIARLYKDCSNTGSSAIIGGLCDSNASYSIFLLFTTGVIGVVLTAYTFGTIVPAGVLMPSLAIGAIFGRVLGMIMEQIQHSSPYLTSLCDSSSKLCISPGAYAVVGSAAFLAGVTKMTVWVVVTVFELTGALTYVLPIMIAVLIARLTSDKFDEYNCYDLWIKFFQYPYLNDTTKPLPLVTVDRFIKKLENHEVKVIYAEDILSLEDISQIVEYDFQGLPVLESRQNPYILGWVSIKELDHEYVKLQALHAESNDLKVSFVPTNHEGVIDLSFLTGKEYVKLNTNLELPTIVEIFFKLKPRFVLFYANGLFKGLLTLQDVVSVVQSDISELLELQNNERVPERHIYA